MDLCGYTLAKAHVVGPCALEQIANFLLSCDCQSGITTLHRDPTSGMLSVMQQFRIDQRAGIKDLDGMIGANSVAARYDRGLGTLS